MMDIDKKLADRYNENYRKNDYIRRKNSKVPHEIMEKIADTDVHMPDPCYLEKYDRILWRRGRWALWSRLYGVLFSIR